MSLTTKKFPSKSSILAIEIVTEQIFLRITRNYCQLTPKIMWVSKIIMEVIETNLVRSYHILTTRRKQQGWWWCGRQSLPRRHQEPGV